MSATPAPSQTWPGSGGLASTFNSQSVSQSVSQPASQPASQSVRHTDQPRPRPGLPKVGWHPPSTVSQSDTQTSAVPDLACQKWAGIHLQQSVSETHRPAPSQTWPGSGGLASTFNSQSVRHTDQPRPRPGLPEVGWHPPSTVSQSDTQTSPVPDLACQR